MQLESENAGIPTDWSPKRRYYVSTEPIRLREYGRGVQQMVDHLATIKDDEKRNRLARQILRSMLALQPSLRDNPDFKQKLWDHLMRIGNYALALDCPYRIVPPSERPPHERISYYPYRARKRAYGKNVELMLQKAADLAEGPVRKEMIRRAGLVMKLFQRTYDQRQATDELIFEHMADLSGGLIRPQVGEIELGKVPQEGQLQQPKQSAAGLGYGKGRKGRLKSDRSVVGFGGAVKSGPAAQQAAASGGGGGGFSKKNRNKKKRSKGRFS